MQISPVDIIGNGRRAARLVAVVGGSGWSVDCNAVLELAGASLRHVEVVLVDPVVLPGRGAAFGPSEGTHLLNVPANGMSVRAEDPDDLCVGLPQPSGLRSRVRRSFDESFSADT